VLFRRETSRTIYVRSGVPQGSHLGPLLFLIFMNDLPLYINHCQLHMFADDVKISYTYINSQDQLLLQEDLYAFECWCNRNLLQLNISKCKHMCFYRSARHVATYNLNGVTLETVSEIRDLGVILDRKLQFDVHIHTIVNKASSTLGFIKRWSKEFNDPYVTKLLFTSLVRPILEYASPVWCPQYAVYSNMIESVQKQFLLFALRNLRWDPDRSLPSYEARLKLIRLPTLSSRRTVASVMFLQKLIIGETHSPTLLGRIAWNVPSRPQRFYLPIRLDICRHNYADHEPFRCICKSYNRFYNIICFSFSLNQLKCKLTCHLNSL